MGTWVITGANRGVGLELAKAAHAAGEHVIGSTRTPSEARTLSSLGIQAKTLDITDAASVRRFAKRMFGIGVDVLVNNAAIGGGTSALDKLRMTDVLRYVDTNTCGALRVTNALLDNLCLGHRRMIVNLSSRMGSIAGVVTDEHPCSYAYRISKTALNMATQCMARQFPDLTFVLIHPGWVRTRLGGSSAPLTSAVAAAALHARITGLTPLDTGSFINALTGRQIKW